MRVGLYDIENLLFFDLLFQTTSQGTTWWQLDSDPSASAGVPSKAFGPFRAEVEVLETGFLSAEGFRHIGTWLVAGRSRDGFSARKSAKTGTFIWLESDSAKLGRILNVSQSNDFAIPVLGAFYIIEFSSFSTATSGDLAQALTVCQTAQRTAYDNGLATIGDILAMAAHPPSGSSMKCRPDDLKRVVPGLEPPPPGITPPAWTNRVQSDCFMLGQDLYPYYCQLWYDWDHGAQLTVFVQKDGNGEYTQRFDELLPAGRIGPAISYVYDDQGWKPDCVQAGGSSVPMPVPDFVAAGHGECRAFFSNSPHFGNLSIWSVKLGTPSHYADFWYWFDDKQRGVVFSLAPASSLTIIDYQTFDQGPQIAACMFADPTGQVPACAPQDVVADVAKGAWTHRTG